MRSDTEAAPKAALRELGRIWDRAVWSLLFAIAVAADAWSAVYPSSYPWYGFGLGLFTGIAFSGLAVALTRAR